MMSFGLDQMGPHSATPAAAPGRRSKAGEAPVRWKARPLPAHRRHRGVRGRPGPVGEEGRGDLRDGEGGGGTPCQDDVRGNVPEIFLKERFSRHLQWLLASTLAQPAHQSSHRVRRGSRGAREELGWD